MWRDKIGAVALTIVAMTTVASTGDLKTELMQPDFGVDPKKERPKYMMLSKKAFRSKMCVSRERKNVWCLSPAGAYLFICVHPCASLCEHS